MDALQYGALGLLGIFVAAFWVWQRETTRKQQEAWAERSRRQDEEQAQMIKFVQDLANNAIATMQALVRESVTAQRQTAETLSRLCNGVEHHADKSEEQHREILGACRLSGKQGNQ